MTPTEIKANAYDDLVDLIKSLPESAITKSNTIFTYAEIFEVIRDTREKIVEAEVGEGLYDIK